MVPGACEKYVPWISNACLFKCLFLLCVYDVCVCVFACKCLFMAHMWSDSQRTACRVSSLLTVFWVLKGQAFTSASPAEYSSWPKW